MTENAERPNSAIWLSSDERSNSRKPQQPSRQQYNPRVGGSCPSSGMAASPPLKYLILPPIFPSLLRGGRHAPPDTIRHRVDRRMTKDSEQAGDRRSPIAKRLCPYQLRNKTLGGNRQGICSSCNETVVLIIEHHAWAKRVGQNLVEIILVHFLFVHAGCNAAEGIVVVSTHENEISKTVYVVHAPIAPLEKGFREYMVKLVAVIFAQYFCQRNRLPRDKRERFLLCKQQNERLGVNGANREAVFPKKIGVNIACKLR